MEDFSLVETPLELLPPLVLPKEAGASVIFWGRVRNHNEGKQVLALEYSAYRELALKEGLRILGEARVKFPVESLRAVHRVGALKIGDGAVVVEASSAHRTEAFEACRWIIDEIKHRVPIWKKEHYSNGEAQWVICTHSHGEPQ